MRIIEVRGRLQTSRVLVGEDFRRVGSYLCGRTAFIVTDANVHRLYAGSFPAAAGIVLECGERAKTLETVQRVYRGLSDQGADRSWFVLGIGGGVVCDIAGFAAGTYMRGLPFGFVSTSLLSQVDASVGGKNGVNLDGYKNMIGLFRQPEFVLCDPNLLKTLPEEEIGNGLAEVIKHGLIGDPALLSLLEDRAADIRARDPETMARLVHDSVRFKAAIVERDEVEAGERKILNFGHTLAHAVEAVFGLPHGRAVAVGMVFALRLSRKAGFLKDPALLARVVHLLNLYGLPAILDRDPGPLLEAVAKDKKKSGDAVEIVLLEEAGRPRLHKISLDELREEILDLRQPA